jgi:TRAP-type C4-dicarboxylate transport system permease small subunit
VIISLLDRLHRIEAALAAISYVLVTGLLLSGIIARELFSTTIWGSEKVAVFAAVFAAFLGLTLATAANSHLRPRFTDHWWPDPWQKKVARGGDFFSAFLFFGIAVVTGIYVSDTFINEDRAAVIYWPLWPIQLVIAYSFLSSGVRHLAFALWPKIKPQAEILE